MDPWLRESGGLPFWHRGVYLLAAAPLTLFALMGWEHGALLTFGIPALICVALMVRPVRIGAFILFWPFALLACIYGCLLVIDWFILLRGGSPSVLLDADDSVVFVAVELVFLVVSVLFFVMGRPFALPAPRAPREPSE